MEISRTVAGVFPFFGWELSLLDQSRADSQALSASFSGLRQVSKLFILVSEPIPDFADTQR